MTYIKNILTCYLIHLTCIGSITDGLVLSEADNIAKYFFPVSRLDFFSSYVALGPWFRRDLD